MFMIFWTSAWIYMYGTNTSCFIIRVDQQSAYPVNSVYWFISKNGNILAANETSSNKPNLVSLENISISQIGAQKEHF